MTWDERPESGNGVRGYSDYSWLLVPVLVGLFGLGSLVMIVGNELS